MNRKLWSNEEKVSIVLEILRGDESAASICARHGVSATQAYRWLDRFLKGGRNALTDKQTRILIEQWRREYNHFRPHSVLGYRPPAPEAKLSLTLT